MIAMATRNPSQTHAAMRRMRVVSVLDVEFMLKSYHGGEGSRLCLV